MNAQTQKAQPAGSRAKDANAEVARAKDAKPQDALLNRALATMSSRGLAGPDNAVLLMVSGGSDSTALAYLAHEMLEKKAIGALAMLHVNHKLRGQDAEDDAAFVAQLAALLGIPLFTCEVDIAKEAAATGGNVEAIARHERYLAANEALRSMCYHEAFPIADGRIFTAHTADDRVENFYMRSIVGTGPGGFRSMRYENGPVVRPLMDASREDLRDYVMQRERAGLPVAVDAEGNLWREDATNAHTDKFRAYVRHEVVPRAKERNAQLLEVLTHSMNLIADEDDMMEDLADEAAARCVKWVCESPEWGIDLTEGFRLLPEFGSERRPLQRRIVNKLLARMLGTDARIETASIEAVLAGFGEDGRPNSGYVNNIQGDLAVSANKQGVLVEPMAYFRARRKKM
ncbi:MAG: tRNA lysidine(34) synthetase TilS [Eggerthellaceae bacterium]|nr:tRNA lysidine(34) synthetase TilS [Eggerthellaceae bacterium]